MSANATPVPSGAHLTAVSTGTSDVQSITVPAHANKMVVTVKTTAARVTFDGTTPAPGTPVGLCLPPGVYVFDFVPKGTTSAAAVIKHAADSAATSELSACFLT